MKQKKQNRILAALLAVAMMFQMLPMLAFAAEETVPEAAKVKIDGKDKVYDNVKDAVEDAKSGDTIILGEGNYTLYKSDAATKGKDLTFVGKGTDKTAWNIGALVPDPANYGTEYNGDYSFDGAGTITFRDMTLRSGSADYLGFIRATNTVVDNCVINGKTFYWGYTSAVFKDTTFNAPSGDYALWTYSSPVMIFDGCTFNASGKAINVYTDYSAGKHDITVYFRDCTVNSSSSVKTALNINDSNMEVFKYIIYLSGNNTVNTNTWLDKTTCSRVFGFGDKPASDSGRTDVYVDGVLVWGKQENAQKGELKTHKYSAGEAERQVKRNEGGWNPQDDHYEREVTVKCDLCGRTETSTEKGYKLEYDLSEGEPAEGADYTDKIVAENETVTLAAAPTKEGYFFHYWEDPNGNHYTDPDIIKMTANTKLTAQWGEEPPEVPDTPEGPGCCGEVTGVIIAAGTTVVGYYAGTELLRNCYGLPYWPRNRSELALMLWEDADRPMPESTLLYPDIGQEEKDMDLQHAARWAMENELIPDLNWDSRKPEEEQKFFPTYAVSRARALHAWQKAQQLKQDA
ncbi:MAG: InlB B-repeat-containing protein [Faecalibacterium sp.]|nr:InlB B-repeat-containing protein [Faecalibacterium sp.]